MKTEANENSRYERQMLLPGIGEEGQKKLRQGSVLVIGAGGLGSPALLYLVGAGVGKIGIVDADEISISNLHRQILYAESDVGKNKALAAKEHLEKLNTEVRPIPCGSWKKILPVWWMRMILFWTQWIILKQNI